VSETRIFHISQQNRQQLFPFWWCFTAATTLQGPPINPLDDGDQQVSLEKSMLVVILLQLPLYFKH